MVDQEPRRGKKEKDPVDWKAVDDAIVLKLAEPDPEDPTRKRHDAIDASMAEAVISGIDLTGLSEKQVAHMRDQMTKRILDVKLVTLARIDNYPFLSPVERSRMDEFLSTLRGLNPTMTFRSPSDYATLFTQQLVRPEPEAVTQTYQDPTAPPPFDPNRPIAPGNFLDHVTGPVQPRFGSVTRTLRIKDFSAPIASNDVFGQRRGYRG